MLDHDAIAREYARDGVVRLRGFLSAAEVAELKGEIARYTREIVPRLKETHLVLEADGKTCRNLFHLQEFDSYFAGLMHRPAWVALARALVGGEPVCMVVETFNKPALVGSAVPWHQDNAYFCQSPPDLFTLWMAMDHATVENGAVYYLKGSQHTLLPHRPSGVKGNSMGLAKAPPAAAYEEFCGTLEPGDVLVHHCQTIHRSEPNRSPHPRLGLLLVFRGRHTHDDPFLRQAYSAARQEPKP